MPDTLHLIPLLNRPYFPVLLQSVTVDLAPWADTLNAVGESAHKLVGLSLATMGEDGQYLPEQIKTTGCVVRVHSVRDVEDRLQFIAQGLRRFRILEWLSREPPFVVRVEYPEESSPDGNTQQEDPALRAYANSLVTSIKELISLSPIYNEDIKQFLNHFSTNEPSSLADFAAAMTTAKGDRLQELLETIPVLPRMEKALALINSELEVVRLQAQITEQTKEHITRQQKEMFLRQQLKVIQNELGIARDDRESDADKFAVRLKGLTVPEPVQARVDDELQKLQILEPASAEYGVTRNYLDWVTSVPWGVMSADSLDLKHARAILDRNHAGLDDVKQRIIEFLAVGVYRGGISGAILLLTGPPGVGKTSIGRAIADALGRQFYRFSLGGVRDEAEIKGHRRTYIGAMPGKLVQALKDVKVCNPVIMLDEVDKIGASYHGDPASALLEVLDPEQNSEFLDHYLDLRVDLSNVLFVCTANQLDTVPAALLNRMEVIRLAGYLAEEKFEIARKHLWPRQLERAGVAPVKLKISDGALRKIIESYAREAGVRSLDKQLGQIVRRSVVTLLEDDTQRLSVSRNKVEDLLGAPLFKKQKQSQGVGVVNGLAWTARGGTLLAVEATRVHGGYQGFRLTGRLGSVMQESALIAYSYVLANLERLGGKAGSFVEEMIHLHVPEGATPKDGPSAGVTMATALLSLARGRAIRRNIAMTGELTLTGKVLAIGGVKEKIIAAKKSGVSEIILPAANQRDYEELADYIKQDLIAHFVASYPELKSICFD